MIRSRPRGSEHEAWVSGGRRSDQPCTRGQGTQIPRARPFGTKRHVRNMYVLGRLAYVLDRSVRAGLKDSISIGVSPFPMCASRGR